jgi:hypothetical protein
MGTEVSLGTDFVPRRTMDDDMYFAVTFGDSLSKDKDNGKSKQFFDNTLEVQTSISQLASPIGSVSNRRALTWNIPRLDLIWRSNPYVKRSVDWLSSKALINGIDINSNDQKMVEKELTVTQQKISNLYRPLQKILESGIVYGGSAGLIIIRDRQTPADYMKPLRVDSVLKNDFLGVKPLARWYNIEPALDRGVVTEIGDDSGIYEADLLGTPLYYRVNLSGGLAGFNGRNLNEIDPDKRKKDMFKSSFLVHRSWLLMFNPYSLSHIETQVERYWSTSIVETAYVDIERHEILWSATTKSAVRNNMGILNIDGVESMVANNHTRKLIHEKLNLIKQTSNQGIISIGKNDKFAFAQSSLTGNEKALEQSMRQLANALGVYVNVLFTDRPFDSEGYLQSVFNVQNMQEKEIRPMYNVLIPIVYKSLFGRKIKNFDYKFNTIINLTPTEKSEIMKTMIDVLHIAYEDNGISLMDYQRMLTDLFDNPSNLFHQISQEYVDEVEKGNEDGSIITYQSQNIAMAETLNQMKEQDDGDGISGVVDPRSKSEGKKKGGDPTKSKRPFGRRTPLNKEKDKE